MAKVDKPWQPFDNGLTSKGIIYKYMSNDNNLSVLFKFIHKLQYFANR